jgi:hypothetical protein
LNELLRPFEFLALMPMQIIKCQNLVGELLGSIFFTFLAHHDIFPKHHHHATAHQWMRRGRIRVTDDSAVTLGAEIEVVWCAGLL